MGLKDKGTIMGAKAELEEQKRSTISKWWESIFDPDMFYETTETSGINLNETERSTISEWWDSIFASFDDFGIKR